MDDKCLESVFRDADAIDKQMWNSMFWTLFRLTNRTIEAGKRQLGPVNAEYFVGVHIRMGGNTSTYVDPFRHSTDNDLEMFSNCTKLVQAELKAKCGHQPDVYVASDSDEAKSYMMTHGGSEVYASPVETYHIDKSNITLLNNFTLASDAIWGDFKALMDATCLVVGRSGFSYLSQHLARQQPRCALMFNDCTIGKVKQIVAARAIC
jgi:hypothetical protein